MIGGMAKENAKEEKMQKTKMKKLLKEGFDDFMACHVVQSIKGKPTAQKVKDILENLRQDHETWEGEEDGEQVSRIKKITDEHIDAFLLAIKDKLFKQGPTIQDGSGDTIDTQGWKKVVVFKVDRENAGAMLYKEDILFDHFDDSVE